MSISRFQGPSATKVFLPFGVVACCSVGGHWIFIPVSEYTVICSGCDKATGNIEQYVVWIVCFFDATMPPIGKAHNQAIHMLPGVARRRGAFNPTEKYERVSGFRSAYIKRDFK